MGDFHPFNHAPERKERRIIFPQSEVKATLDGRKSQFRRVISDKILSRFDDLNPDNFGDGMPSYETEDDQYGQLILLSDLCPFGQVGDRLWVAESWSRGIGTMGESFVYAYKATQGEEFGPFVSPVAMPREASRITLEITGVRVERLQDISEEDAIAEGIENSGIYTNLTEFKSLWNSTTPKNPWDSNPWVWAVTFSRLED